MCALLKYSGAKWVFDDVITDVCDSHFLCPWNDNHHVDMDCIFNFFSFIYFVYLCRWLNCENPLINHNPWTAQGDKNSITDLILLGHWGQTGPHFRAWHVIKGV